MLKNMFLALSVSVVAFSTNAQNTFTDITKQGADKNALKISLSGYLGNFDYTSIADYEKAEHLKIAAAYGIDFENLFTHTAKLASLKELEITTCRIQTLPGNIGLVRQIEKLNLRNNQLQNLPDAVFKLNLRAVDLSENAELDSAVIKQLAQFPQLEILYLEQCEWSVLPADIGSLKTLKILSLKGNVLTSLPETIGSLQQLEELDLSPVSIGFRTNKLPKLPQSFGNLTKLKKLDLTGNSLTILPANFANLQQLEYLKLEQNQLPDFPASLTKLKNLKYLNLNENTIINLPANIDELSNLTELRLNNNFFNQASKKLKVLPASITKLSKLKTLTLRDNVVEQLPENIGDLHSLEHLDLRDNLFSVLPESFCKLQNLRYLDLKANEMTALPACFTQLTALEDLTVAFNPSLKTEKYIAVFTQLQSLKFIDVSHNDLTKESLEPLIQALPNCRIVNLGGSKNKIPQEDSKGQEFWNSAPPDRKK